MGVDLDRAWTTTSAMIEACGEVMPAASHPALYVGAVIGALAREDRDKVCFFCTHTVSSFGDWVEQLIAESIGKEGKGVIPIVGATVGQPHDYSSDRLFVYLRVDNDSDLEEMDNAVKTLREAGHPRLTLRLPDAYALFGEFFRWEYATAVVGQMLALNPFDEPNVTEAKEATAQLLKQYQENGSLPDTDLLMEGEHVRLYSNEKTIAPLREMCRAHGYSETSRTELLAAQMASTHAGDYFAVLAYLTPDEQTNEQLRSIQRRLRHVTRRAVSVGYGPRYLHSTGQMHKGGPNTGVFFLITRSVEHDLMIPDNPFSFGTLFMAQAIGDYTALCNHDRRVIRLHIEGDQNAGIDKLLAAIEFVEKRWK